MPRINIDNQSWKNAYIDGQKWKKIYLDEKLIHRADLVVLDGSDTGGADTGGWVTADSAPSGAYQDGKIVPSGINVRSTYFINRTMWTSKKIDLSEYKKMTIELTVNETKNGPGYGDTRGYGLLANGSRSYSWSSPDGGSWVDWGTTYQWRKFDSRGSFTDTTVRDDIHKTGKKRFVVDVSGWTGSYYIGVVSGCGPGEGQVMDVTFNKIILE